MSPQNSHDKWPSEKWFETSYSDASQKVGQNSLWTLVLKNHGIELWPSLF